jgi:hypothetical protein
MMNEKIRDKAKAMTRNQEMTRTIGRSLKKTLSIDLLQLKTPTDRLRDIY